MKRRIEAEIFAWKRQAHRKPLVLMGARQVGKTWLMEDFARKNFKHAHVIDFREHPDYGSIFMGSKNPADLLPKLSAVLGQKIDVTSDVLVFDEIQDCNEALNSLKYFREKCPELAVMAAGSLLGVRIGKRKGNAQGRRLAEQQRKTFPVGKVDLLDVEPLDFAEYLEAKDPALYEYYLTLGGECPIDEVFHNKLTDALNEYLFVGGMPECVASYLEDRDPRKVEKIQRDILQLYEDDIVKYNGEIDAGKILLVLRSIVPQLAKANEKFLYDVVREGARARGYEEAIEWLVSARIVRRVNNLSRIKYPLAAYDIRGAFKLFFLDIGLLRSMAGVSFRSIVLNEDFAFKGPFVENFVVQQLFGRTVGPVRYWADRSDREIDFVIQREDEAIPIEVKGGEDKKAPSFKSFVKTHAPLNAIRFSRRNLRRDGGFVNIPLYLTPRYEKCLRAAAELQGECVK